jgi:hypothetical protein
MRLFMGLSLAAAALAAAPSAGAASVEIRDAVVRVTVLPEARSDVVVQIIRTNPKLPLRVTREGDGRVVVDGGPDDSWLGGWLGRRAASCNFSGAHPSVTVWGVGSISLDDMPRIIVRTPMDAEVSTSGATIGTINRTESLTLSIAGCDDWTVGNVRGRMKIHNAGSGQIRTGSAGELVMNIAGSGTLRTRAIGNGVSARIAGSGEVDIEQASGPIDVSIAGHGDVRIGGGHATDMKVSIVGSGDVAYKGVADNLRAAIAGSGEIVVAKVTGDVRKSIAGSGSIDVGR